MTIEEYLNQCEPGETRPRREAWSIERIKFARKVWADVVASTERPDALMDNVSDMYNKPYEG